MKRLNGNRPYVPDKSPLLRKTGINLIGDVGWGTHFCQFYQTRQDLLDILVPYFKAGLENNEFCMWVTAEPLGVEEARTAMGKAIPGFGEYAQKGQIEIIPYNEWYTLGGSFDANRVLNGWVSRLDNALAKGFDGLRLTGNTFWIEKEDWEAFTDYEETVNSIIGKYKMLAICTYSLDRCGVNEIIDVVTNHQLALIKRSNKWESIEGSERRKTVEALCRSEKQYRTLFENMLDGFAYCKMIFDDDGRPIDFIYLNVNSTFSKLTGLKDVVGKRVTEVIPGIRESSPELFDIYGRVALTGKAERFEIYLNSLGIWFSVSVYSTERGYFIAVFDNITGRKQAENALHATLDRYRSYIEVTGHLGWTCNAAGEVVEDIPSWRKYTGQSYEEIKGWGWAKALHPDDVARTTEVWKKAVREKSPYETEYRVRRYDGIYRHFMDRAIPVLEKDGTIREWVGTCVDITERKQAEERLHSAHKLVKTNLDAMTRLHKLGTLFPREGNLSPVLAEIVETAIAISGADFGNIQVIDPASSDLRIAAQHGFPQWWLDFWNSVSRGQGACGTALERGERVIVEDVEQSPIFIGTPALQIQLKAGVRAVQSTLLVSRSGKPLGMFSTHYKAPHRPDDRTLQLLDILARQAADIIEQAQAEASLRGNEKILLKENREVTVSSRILEVFVKEAGDDLYAKTLDIILEAMESKYGVFGYIDEQGDLICPTMSKIFDQCEMEDKCICYPRQKWTGLWSRALLEKKTLYSNKQAVVPTGHIPIRRSLATPIIFQGNIIGLFNLANKDSDYTEGDREFIEAVSNRIAPVLYARIQKEFRERERRQAEESLRESEARWRTLVDNIPDLVTFVNREGKVLFVNLARLSLTADNITGANIYDAIDRYLLPEYRDMVRQSIKQVFQTGLPVHYEAASQIHLPPVEGGREAIRWYSSVIGPVKYDNRVEGAIFVSRDITERKETEKRLDKLASFPELNPRPIVEVDFSGNITYANPGARKLFPDLEVKCLNHPYLSNFNSVIKIFEKGQPPPLTREVKVNDNWFHQTIFHAMEFNCIRIYGMDITRRKQVEERLKVSLSEKDVLLRELYHRTKNNMQVISSLMNLQSITLNDEKLLVPFKEMQNRIQAMSLVHEKLYKSQDLSNLSISEYIGSLAESLLSGFNGRSRNITLNLDIEDIPFSIDLAIPCGLVINELMTNALKYAFPDGKSGQISISLHARPDDEIKMVFADNGVGLPDNLDVVATKSLGMKIIHTLVKMQLEGEVELLRDKGTEYRIWFKCSHRL